MRLLTDTWLVFTRNTLLMLRSPFWLVFGLFQPICYLLLLGPLLEDVAAVPGFPPGGAFNVFVPGIFVMTAVYSTAFVGFSLIADLRAGVIERLRVSPLSPLALPLGLALRDTVMLMVQCGLLAAIAWPMGLRIGAGGAALMLALLALVALSLSCVSYAFALAIRDENGLASTLNTFALPLLLLSGVILPLSLAPPLLQNLARFNPFAHAVDAARALTNGDLGDPSVPLAFAVMAAVTALSFAWVARSFRTATR